MPVPTRSSPDLAGFLNNLSNHFSALGRREEALASIEEAVAVLREPFLAQPIAFRQQMTLMILNYRERCKDAGREESLPSLWTPILEILQRLQDQSVE